MKLTFLPWRFPASALRISLLATVAAVAFFWQVASAQAQSPMDAFHWIDFHDAKDGPTVAWVTQALKAEHWTSMREIGALWDAAIVITSERKSPQAAPSADLVTVWNVSLARHEAQPLLRGVNPRILGWTSFGGNSAGMSVPELGLVYDDCTGCAASTYFTTLYYNMGEHAWRARWMRGDQAAALYSASPIEGVVRTQIYGLLTEPGGRNVLATWSHFDYGKAKPAEDFVFQYDVDPATGGERTQALGDKHGDLLKQRLCKADPGQIDPGLAELARGQDSAECRDLGQTPVKGGRAEGRVRAAERPARAEPSGRTPVTSPPANNHGQSSPPKARGANPAPAKKPDSKLD